MLLRQMQGFEVAEVIVTIVKRAGKWSVFLESSMLQAGIDGIIKEMFVC